LRSSRCHGYCGSSTSSDHSPRHDYRELYSVSTETTLASFLGQGLGPLILSRLEGLRAALVTLATGPLLVVLVPLALIGLWRQRRETAFMPWSAYAVVLIAFSAIVSAVHVPYGTFLHSAVALLPHAYLLSALGLAVLVRWVADRRPSWDAPRATRVFSIMLVIVFLIVSAVGTLITIRGWQAQREGRVAILEALATHARPGDVVMSPDAGAYRYFGGWPGIVTPEDPLPVIEEALRRYDVRWLVLERAHMVNALGPVLAGKTQPDWLSDPLVATAPPAHPDAGRDDDTTPEAALYAVCLAEDDARCDR
jgi:hypothetical protein